MANKDFEQVPYLTHFSPICPKVLGHFFLSDNFVQFFLENGDR